MTQRIAALLLFLIACGEAQEPPDPKPEPGSNGLSIRYVNADQVAEIRDALQPNIDAINDALGCQAIEIGGRRYPVMVSVSGPEITAIHIQNAVGITEYEGVQDRILLLPFVGPGGQILGDETPGGAYLRQQSVPGVYVHELGHAFGIGHEDGTVMAASGDRIWTPTEAAQSLVKLLDKYNLHPCR